MGSYQSSHVRLHTWHRASSHFRISGRMRRRLFGLLPPWQAGRTCDGIHSPKSSQPSYEMLTYDGFVLPYLTGRMWQILWWLCWLSHVNALHEKERALVIACDDIFPSASISESSHAAASFKLHMWRNEPHVITWDKYVAFCLRIWIVTCDGFRTFSFTCGASSLCGWMQQHFSFCLHIWIVTCGSFL